MGIPGPRGGKTARTYVNKFLACLLSNDFARVLVFPDYHQWRVLAPGAARLRRSRL